MHVVYPVKVKYKDGVIVGLISPHLRVDFINRYIDLIGESAFNDLMLPLLPSKKIEIERLQIVIEKYVKWIQDNNYVLRLPNYLQEESLQQDEHWISIKLNIPLKKDMFENISGIIAVSLFVVTFILNECFFILAGRLNKVSYITLILPVLTDFTMSGIIYAYSGASSNIIDKGRQLDDWWRLRQSSPAEIDFEEKNQLYSSQTLARFILLILPIASTIFSTFSAWQGMMSMRRQFEASNIVDPILTSKFIYNIAIVTLVIDSMYSVAQLSSFSLKATNTLKTLLDNCYAVFRKKTISTNSNNYVELLINDEQTERDDTNTVEVGTDTVVVSPSSIIQHTKGSIKEEIELSVLFITDVVYNNLLIKQDLLYEARKIGGIKAVQNLINLGENAEVASLIIECIEQYGVKHVLNILFDCTAKNYKVETELSNNQITAMTTYTQQNSKIFMLSEIEKVVDQIIEQNFFLNTEKGKEFVQAVANYFDKETLLKIFELGRDQDIVEQILFEAEAQGISRIIPTLLGKESPATGTTDNLENILGIEELNQLRIVPNGIFNSWSNRAYHKVVEYIDNLAKNLDDLLNTGRSGSQVAVTIALLEEWIGFAASGQRFIGGMPPYYNPHNDNEWSYGSGGSNDGNNSSAGSFDSHHELVGLILPAYNGTDYDINHQM